MAPYPRITTYPPLGQLTAIQPEQEHISFTLIIEWNLVRPRYPFEICLAYTVAKDSQHESRWKTIPLTRTSKEIPHILDAEDCQRAVYSGLLKRQDFTSQAPEPLSTGHCHFTVKFRVDAQAPWQWVSTLDGTAPGELVLQQALSTTNGNYSGILNNLDLTSDWNIECLGDSRELCTTQAFLLESKTPIQKTSGTDFAVLPLASLTSLVRYFSIVRLEPYWLGPRQGRGPFFYTSEDAIISSFLLSNGLILTFVVLGWVDNVYQVFRSDDQGRIVVAAQNDDEEDRSYRVVMSIGLKFEDTMTSAMDQVRTAILTSSKIAILNTATKDINPSIDLTAAARSTEQWLDSLSFCTWNALGQNLTQSKILTALDHLKQNKVHISTLLIDDNWQTLGPTKYDYTDPFHRGWSSMEANSSAAPSGLKSLIGDIRTKHPHIKDIGVWHALMGYWGGISPSGPIASQYPTTDISALLMGNKPATITSLSASALHSFYSDFYSFLRSCGVTFVKTDVQHMLSTYSDPQTRRDLISTYQSAWTTAHLKHFNGKAISCMSQIPQTLFHSLLQTSTPPIVQRNSDDFYPEVPASHPWHVWVNAHNAVFSRHLNVVSDWDMFQSDHEFSAYHAAARCVSGGPILITDEPGKHDVNLIGEMTARGFGGGSVALRTGAGVTGDVFGLYTEGGLLNVRAETGKGSGAVVMALFNITEREVRGLVHVKEFGSTSVDEVLVRGHRTGELFGPIVTSTLTESTGGGCGERDREGEMKKLIHVRLAVRGWDILTAQPVQRVETSSGVNVKVCVLGLLGKMSGAAAITASSVFVENAKIKIHVSLKALGRLGIWFDSIDARSKIEVQMQGSKVDERFLKLVTLSESRSGRGSGSGRGSDDGTHEADTATTNGLKMPHMWQVDVEAYWEQHQMWDERCREVVVDFVVG